MPPFAEAPYGAWTSPITSELIVSETIGFAQVALDGGDVYWIETRPSEGGRQVVVRRRPDGTTSDLTPPPFNARSRVNEYGGGAMTVVNGTVWFSNFVDQRLYRQAPDAAPVAITPAGAFRYADSVVDAPRARLLCVREDHAHAMREAVTTLVAVPLTGDVSNGHVLLSGHDFYASPRVSPDGRHLAWMTWDHPNMPWNGTDTVEVLCPMAAEFGAAQWSFGISPIHFTDRLSCPLILFQGLDDPVVPPSQAERMFDALRGKGLPVAYVAFEGEQHGFRRAENIRRALDAELYFYAKVFGFEPGERLEPVPIENLP